MHSEPEDCHHEPQARDLLSLQVTEKQILASLVMTIFLFR